MWEPDDATQTQYEVDSTQVWRERRRYRPARERQRGNRPSPYLFRRGLETIQLDLIEFRILQFLAATPYRAFSRRTIAAAVSTPRVPVPEESLDRHIARLRERLGIFHDYIQTVPHLGYRFKA
jgi:DNA-binding response OmpR family regulator